MFEGVVEAFVVLSFALRNGGVPARFFDDRLRDFDWGTGCAVTGGGVGGASEGVVVEVVVLSLSSSSWALVLAMVSD